MLYPTRTTERCARGFAAAVAAVAALVLAANVAPAEAGEPAPKPRTTESVEAAVR